MAMEHTPKRILILGNLGYVGPVLTQHLATSFPQAELIGYDIGFFESCLLSPDVKITAPHQQLYGDIRTFDPAILEGVDSIIALAAVSNDPMGLRYETETMDINAHSIVKIAAQAKAAGAKTFAFASSCSVYGMGGIDAVTESSPVNPLTAYARSKLACEEGLSSLADENFTITCLRFATACGISPRLRLDLVLNDFVASALLHRRIDILSDGTPWRPLIDVIDMSRAMEWAIMRSPSAGGPHLIVNTGANHWNFTVAEIAKHVADKSPAEISIHINPDAAPDKRSYKVDFSLFQALAPKHTPIMTAEKTITALFEDLQAAQFKDVEFRKHTQLIRLNTLKMLEDDGKIDQHLRWVAR